MIGSIRFPKSNSLFSNDSELMKQIKGLEDRIELRYQSLRLQTALLPLVRLYEEPREISERTSEMDPALLKALSVLAAPLRQRSSLFDTDRDRIDEMKRRQGSLYVLGLLSPRLMMSMELLFAGVVTLYIQMFNSSTGRLVLKGKRVYPDKELRSFHEHMLFLRNKHYAHKATELGRHDLSYTINERGDIELDSGGVHEDAEFHGAERCRTLYKCLDCVIRYLDDEIEKNGVKILDSLTAMQLEALRNPTA